MSKKRVVKNTPKRVPVRVPIAPKERKPTYTVGEVFTDPYLGTTITEILNEEKRAGWVWVQECGKIIVSPHLGFYLWFNEGGEEWTMESGAQWLIRKRE